MRYQQTLLFPLEEPTDNVVAGRTGRKPSPRRPAASPPTAAAPQPRSLLPPATSPGSAPQPAAPPRVSAGSPATAPPAAADPADRLDHLRQLVRRMEARGRSADAPEPVVFSAGGAVLNALLPHGGLRPGTLVEWVCDARQSGAMLLAMIAAAEVLKHPASAARPLVVADGLGTDVGAVRESFYPPAAVALGVPAERMVIFRKQQSHTRSDLVWAIDQALRCGAVAAVLAEIGDWLSPADARRLQLAAETGGAIGLLVRPTRSAAKSAGVKPDRTAASPLGLQAKTRASFADIRWSVSALPGQGGRRLQVELARCRGGVAGGSRLIEIDARPQLSPMGAAGRDRVVALRGPGASDVAAAMAGGLVGQLAGSASAVRPGQRRSATRRQAS